MFELIFLTGVAIRYVLGECLVFIQCIYYNKHFTSRVDNLLIYESIKLIRNASKRSNYVEYRNRAVFTGTDYFCFVENYFESTGIKIPSKVVAKRLKILLKARKLPCKVRVTMEGKILLVFIVRE